MSKVKQKLEVSNVDSPRAKIHLYGIIRKAIKGWDEEGDCISAQSVIKALTNLKGKDVDIHVNSPGGDVYESSSIRSAILDYTGEVHVYIDGVAASGASLFITAADKVFMYETAMQMIHRASTLCFGNASDFEKAAVDLSKHDQAVIAAYKSRFVGTEEELVTLVNEETFLTADECLAVGLCDEIIKAEKKEEPQTSTKESILAKYMKSPEANKPSLITNFKKGTTE